MLLLVVVDGIAGEFEGLGDQELKHCSKVD